MCCSQMMDAVALSEYELARLERIKENQMMLEQLFPEGTNVLSYSSQRRKRSDDEDSGVSVSGNGTPDSVPRKKKCYSVRSVAHSLHPKMPYAEITFNKGRGSLIPYIR